MNSAATIGMRNLWSATTSDEKTMTPREMALTSWGAVHKNINVNSATGERWFFDANRNLFVAY